MKYFATFVFATLMLVSIARAQPAAPAPATPAAPAAQSALEPAPKVDKDGKPQKRFMELHDKFVSQAKEGNIDLLFLGDSITEGWNGPKDVWTKNFSQWKPANFGIGGDRTQHVLWR